MKTHRSLLPGRPALLATLALCWWWPASHARAALTYDLRVNGGKLAVVTGVGQVITMDLYAQVTGASGNSAPEGFQEGFGSVLSSANGNITGNISSSFVAPFDATGAQPGVQQTLDSDSDLDLGSNDTAHYAAYFYARATGMQTAGTPIPNGTEYKIATFFFTVQSVGSYADYSAITVNFRVPLFSNQVDIEALWQEDGQTTTSNGLNGGTQPTVGLPIQLYIPEPSTTALLLLAAAGAAARRRRPVRSQLAV